MASPRPALPLAANSPRLETSPCPRCKEPGLLASDYCARCGFSFSETRSLEEPPVANPGGLVGQVINGKYRVLSILGEGGFGVVYKVELLLFDTANCFALKLLHPSLSQDKNFRRRFLREAGLAMALIHENTIQIREFGQTEDGQLFFTMDYSPGEPVKAMIVREGFLNVNRALHITRQVLSVMKLAHSRGIIHRDLKPENIFLEKDTEGRDFVKVGDFGLAKSFGNGEDALARRRVGRAPSPSEDISRGAILGTPRYMSPEQALGRDDLDDRSDLYSIGIVLYEMLYGQVPAERMSAETVGLELRTPLPQPGHEVPPAVWEVVRKALCIPRESRYQSAGEFIEALNALPQYTPTYAESDVRRRGRARGSLWSYAAVGALAFGAAVVAVRWRSGLGPWPWGGDWKEESRIAYPKPRGGLVPPGNLTRGSASPTPLASSVAEARAQVERLPLSIQVAAYFAIEVSDEFVYQTYRSGIIDREIVYKVLEEPERGVFTVSVSPGDRKFQWIVDSKKNTVSQEFLLPNAGTGALTEVHRQQLLALPGPDDIVRRQYAALGNELVAFLEPVELVLPETDPKVRKIATYAECLRVESRDGARVRYAYYQEGAGLVGMEVYESQEAALKPPGERPAPLYARYLVEHRQAAQ